MMRKCQCIRAAAKYLLLLLGIWDELQTTCVTPEGNQQTRLLKVHQSPMSFGVVTFIGFIVSSDG